MRIWKTVFSVLTLVLFVFGATQAFAQLSVRGRATGLHVMAPSLGVPDQMYYDSGMLPPTGGDLGGDALGVSIVGIATGDEINWNSHGDDCEGDSHVEYVNGVVLPGQPGEITFSRFHGHDDDHCCDTEGDKFEAFVIEGLTFGGVPVTVTGDPDQKVSIAGVGELTINWWDRHHDDDCDDDDFSVHALRLVLDGGDEIVLGSVFFESDDHCCPVPTEGSTWGSIKDLFKATVD